MSILDGVINVFKLQGDDYDEDYDDYDEEFDDEEEEKKFGKKEAFFKQP